MTKTIICIRRAQERLGEKLAGGSHRVNDKKKKKYTYGNKTHIGKREEKCSYTRPTPHTHNYYTFECRTTKCEKKRHV